MINDEAQTKSLSTQLSLTTNQTPAPCDRGQHGQRGLQHELYEFVGQPGEDGDGRGRRGRAPAAVRLRAGTKWKNLMGAARWSNGTEMDYSHLTSVLWGVGLPGTAGQGGRVAGPAVGAE